MSEHDGGKWVLMSEDKGAQHPQEEEWWCRVGARGESADFSTPFLVNLIGWGGAIHE